MKKSSFKFQLLLWIFCIACSATTHKEEKALQEISLKERLIEGNKRYREFHPIHPNQTRERLTNLSSAQSPFAVVVSCSDSRVPPEIIFDQGLGDLFVIRTAGNVLGEYELASIEYAVLKLNTQVIIVMGHEKCGAIAAFLEHANDTLPGHLNELVNFIRTQPTEQKIQQTHGDHNYEAVINNILYGVQYLKTNSTVIEDKFRKKELEIYGAIYQLQDGNVFIIDEEVNNEPASKD